MERREPSSSHGANLAMKTMTETLVDGRLDETVLHGAETEAEDKSDVLSEQPMGNDLMSDPHSPQPLHDRYAFASGARPLDGYTIKRAVGRGGFGEVYYAVSDSGREVALKLILRNLEVERRGVIHCMNLKCPNLLTIFDLKTNDAGDTFVIMEYVAGPSLARILRENPNGLPTAEIRHWMKGLVEGVAYLHDHGVVHRDLKPANLFLEEGVVKIGDYGLAKLITASHDGGHSESIGTCHYMAPEIGSGNYGKAIDVYAVGVILHEMLTGRVPFDGESVNEILMKHLTARPDVSILPDPYREIVARALAKDPRQRPERLHELLLPEDAPRPPEVRIIGARPAIDDQPSVVINQPRPRPNPDPIHRIEAEADAENEADKEPIFYIGPDTMPPPPSPKNAPRGEWRRKMRKPGANPRKAPSPGRSPGLGFGRDGLAGRDWLGRPLEPEPIPPAPLALTGRARVAELTASMLWAALALALLALPAAAALGIDLQREPQRIVFLFGAALLSTWAALIVAKALEERRGLDGVSRRIVAAVGGGLVGVGAIFLAHALRLGSSTAPGSPAQRWPVAPVIFFALLFFAVEGWQGQASRSRPRRFRILPILWAALVSAAFSQSWKNDQPGLVALAVMCATTIQIVSPWNAQAARYAKYLRKSEKKRRKTAAA